MFLEKKVKLLFQYLWSILKGIYNKHLPLAKKMYI